MNEFGILPKSYELILQSLNSYPEIESVLIFGSRAKGNYRNGSDVDLVIDGDKCSSEIALELSSILNERLPIPYYFDIVFLKDIDTATQQNFKYEENNFTFVFNGLYYSNSENIFYPKLFSLSISASRFFLFFSLMRTSGNRSSG